MNPLNMEAKAHLVKENAFHRRQSEFQLTPCPQFRSDLFAVKNLAGMGIMYIQTYLGGDSIDRYHHTAMDRLSRIN